MSPSCHGHSPSGSPDRLVLEPGQAPWRAVSSAVAIVPIASAAGRRGRVRRGGDYCETRSACDVSCWGQNDPYARYLPQGHERHRLLGAWARQSVIVVRSIAVGWKRGRDPAEQPLHRPLCPRCTLMGCKKYKGPRNFGGASSTKQALVTRSTTALCRMHRQYGRRWVRRPIAESAANSLQRHCAQTAPCYLYG